MKSGAHNRFPKLAEYLRRWCQGDTSDEISRYLVTVAASLAKQYLRRRLLAASHADEATPDCVAISASAAIFAADGSESPLGRLLRTQADNDSRLVHAFVQYSLRVISNSLYGRIKDIDPAGFKLSERIQEALATDKYVCWPGAHPHFVRMTVTSDLNLDGVTWSAHEIMRVACQAAASDGGNVSQWVAVVMATVADSAGYQRFTEIEILKYGLRLANASLLSVSDDDSHSAPVLDPVTTARIHEHIDRSRGDGHTYLGNYKRQDKLGGSGLETLHRALDVYVDEIKAHGQPRQSQFDYVAEQVPGLTLSYYQAHYKSAFEGALSVVWKRIRSFQDD